MAAYADLAMEIQKVARGREFEGYAALPGLPDFPPIRYAHALLVGNGTCVKRGRAIDQTRTG